LQAIAATKSRDNDAARNPGPHMPEGDTILRAARAMDQALAGDVVTRFESVYPALTRVAEDRPLVGRTIAGVSARGKHLLMAFSGDLVLRTHMRMNGSWHLYRPGARWQRPRRDMRVLVGTDRAIAVGFNVPVAEFLTARELERHSQIAALGPDLLADDYDAHAALGRLRAHPRETIADALLNQRIVAGIGNVFKSEILFVARVYPFTPVAALADVDLERILTIAREQLRANVLSRTETLTPGIGRRTTRSLDPNSKLWVYSRGGKPCRLCGKPIASRKTGLDARVTYWCPDCQKQSNW
jgi:endonuclease-8